MFITNYNFERILELHERLLKTSVDTLQSELSFYKTECQKLREQVDYERMRADAAVDRLLAKEAHIAAITPPGAHAAAEEKVVKDRLEKVNKIFSDLASVGEDVADEDPNVKTEILGERV